MKNPRIELEDFKRFREILTILTEEGFGFIAQKLRVLEHVPITSRVNNQRRETNPERLRETIGELGTTYIKFGQILAEGPDIIPEKYTQELEKLQDSVPSFKSEKAIQIIDEEVGLENFSQIKKEPLASASIAQVHYAKLNNGEKVAVKVRRPGIKEEVEKDLDILNYLATKAERHLAKMEKIEVISFVKEFSKWTREELDLEKEGLNAQIFRENMSEEEDIKIPETYPALTTEKVLVMEYVEGVKCTEEEKLKELDIPESRIAKTAIKAGLKQSIIDGFFHADPHPSNFMISDEGEIIYLDFGMMGKITPGESEKLGLILLYLVQGDTSSLVDCLEELGNKTENYNRENVEDIVEEKNSANKKYYSRTKQYHSSDVQPVCRGLKERPPYTIKPCFNG